MIDSQSSSDLCIKWGRSPVEKICDLPIKEYGIMYVYMKAKLRLHKNSGVS